jgi:hypothetical protein
MMLALEDSQSNGHPPCVDSIDDWRSIATILRKWLKNI